MVPFLLKAYEISLSQDFIDFKTNASPLLTYETIWPWKLTNDSEKVNLSSNAHFLTTVNKVLQRNASRIFFANVQPHFPPTFVDLFFNKISRVGQHGAIIICSVLVIVAYLEIIIPRTFLALSLRFHISDHIFCFRVSRFASFSLLYPKVIFFIYNSLIRRQLCDGGK